MDALEIRLRLIEAAAKNPLPHPEGYAHGILAAAEQWEQWIMGAKSKPLGLPKKGVGDLK